MQLYSDLVDRCKELRIQEQESWLVALGTEAADLLQPMTKHVLRLSQERYERQQKAQLSEQVQLSFQQSQKLNSPTTSAKTEEQKQELLAIKNHKEPVEGGVKGAMH